MRAMQRVSGSLTALRRCTASLPGALQLLLAGIKTQANEVRSGNVVEVDGSLLEVVKAAHAAGRGRQLGNVQFELRCLRTGRKQQLRQRPYDMIEVAQLRTRPFQFLYAEGSQLCLMDPDTFTQVTVDESLFGGQRRWLADGMQVSLSLLPDGRPVLGELPATVTLTVADAGAYVKGDSAAAHTKPCRLENGQEVAAPPYVQTGQQVVVDTRSGEFVKRLT